MDNVLMAKVGEGPGRRTSGLREANLPRHFENKKGEPQPQPPAVGEPDGGPDNPPDELPEPEDEVGIKEGEIGKDPQLDHAVELLKSWKVFKTLVAKRDDVVAKSEE